MGSAESLPKLSSAMEDYLEAIYHLEQERRIARVRDIAKRLDVKMSSVSSALKSLNQRGLIKYDPHQFITLTDRGILKAKEIVRRHEILKRFLVRVLDIDDESAEDNACRLEHHLDPEVTEKLIGFMEFVETCPLDQTRWFEGLAEGCDDCLRCLDEARKRVIERAEAQETALAEGMTLAEANVGTQVMVESIKGPVQLKRKLAKDGLEEGVVTEIERVSPETDTYYVNVKGYHVTLEGSAAAKILVKPV